MSTRAKAKPSASQRLAAREKEIIAAATLAFGTRPYDEVSMSDIGDAVGIVEGTIYRYFESKHHLVQRVVAEWYAEMYEDLAAALARLDGTRTRLRFCIHRHLRVYVENTGLSNLMIRDLRRDRNYYETKVHELNRKYALFVTQTLQHGVSSGELKKDTPIRVVRDLIFGGIEHVAERVLSGRGGIDIEAVTDDILNVLWAGIAVDSNGLDRIAMVERRVDQMATTVSDLLGSKAANARIATATDDDDLTERK